jgi:hypothetical protein
LHVPEGAALVAGDLTRQREVRMDRGQPPGGEADAQEVPWLPVAGARQPDRRRRLVRRREGAVAVYLTDAQRKLAGQNVLVWGDGGYSGVKLDDPIRVREIKDAIEKWEADILFIEPFRSLWAGEENSSTDMAVVADNMQEIAGETQCGVLLSHHDRKAGAGDDGEEMSAIRGSTVLEGVTATIEHHVPRVGNQFRELSWSKVRHGQAPPPVRLQWDADAWWYRHVSTEDIGERILAAIAEGDGEPMSVKDIVEATDETKRHIGDAMPALVKAKRVVKFPSVSFQGGSTGNRYGIKSPDEGGGVSIG